MYKIFIVEDDEYISSLLGSELASWGYITAQANDFANIMRELRAFEPHLILMDIALPFYNGFYWCAEIRKESTVPLIFISSAADNMSLVSAIHNGADDFITKPFDLPVLTAKIQAILRRSYAFGKSADVLEAQGAVLDVSGLCLLFKERKIELTKNETKILQLLLENKGRAISRDRLADTLWNSGEYVDENTLTVNVSRLRNKLAGVELENLIKTKKGVGYIVE